MGARYPTLPSLAAHICSQGVEERWARITERGQDNEKARRKAGLFYAELSSSSLGAARMLACLWAFEP